MVQMCEHAGLTVSKALSWRFEVPQAQGYKSKVENCLISPEVWKGDAEVLFNNLTAATALDASCHPKTLTWNAVTNFNKNSMLVPV